MKTKLGWSNAQGAQALCLTDRLAVEPATDQPAEPIDPVMSRIDPVMSRETFQRLLAFEHRDEDRRLSAAAAFTLFLFGVTCGALWTTILTWLL